MAGPGGVPPGPGAAMNRLRRWTRRDSADGAEVLDLTDVEEVTTTLLAPPPEFQGVRRRVVDQFTILSANRLRVNRSINWGPLDGLLTQTVPGSNRLDTRGRLPAEVSLLVPVSTLPKRALVAFNLAGPGGGDAHLMPYTTSVAIQGRLVYRMADVAGCPAPPPQARRMVDAISRFRPGRLTGNRPDLTPYWRPLTIPALHSYLNRDADTAVSETTLRHWTALAEPAQIALHDALAEPYDPLSSADTLLLALGELWRDPEVPTGLTETAIEGYLREFVHWVSELVRVGPAAVPVLSTVAEYGRRWEALASVTLDPYRPCLIKMTEERRTMLSRRSPVRNNLPWWRWPITPVATVDLDPGGPGSYHVSVGTDDTSVEISNPAVIDLYDRRVERTFIEDVQRNREVYAFYSTDARRQPRARLVVALRVSPDVSRVTAAILSLMVITVGLSALPFELGADAVSVVAVPSSFAATVLLTRERSSLAAWVLGPAKAVLLILLVVLALLSGLRALGWHSPPQDTSPNMPISAPGQTGDATASPSRLALATRRLS